MERIVTIDPAYERRRDHCGCKLRMVLKGKLGAVHLVIFTGWYIDPEARAHSDPSGADLGYHSPRPFYEDQSIALESCKYLDGKPCYCDGSVLNADRVFEEVLIPKGSDGVWEYLEGYYTEKFGALV